VITALTAQNTKEVRAIHAVPLNSSQPSSTRSFPICA
jgi:Hydroxymethylpyrimidine/phosphomethylpyrimidine kinase